MSFIKINNGGSETDTIHLHYEDLGTGQPVVFVHGWPLSGDMWEYQVTELVQQGIRCISYDRRGFGKSSRPASGYNYDTMAEDLHALLQTLQLEDVILVGFSMGGGEVARYMSRYGGERVSRIVFISSVTPYMLKTTDNPEGVDKSVFEEIMAGLKQDRIGFLDDFGKKFFGINLLHHPVSTPLLDYYRDIAAFASPIATQQCAIAFSSTDFRDDLKTITVPTLIIHGTADKTVPIEVSGDRTATLLPHAQYVIYDGAPHGLFYTHKETLNKDLLKFINGREAEGEGPLQPVGAFEDSRF
ncbi:alpha/beta fold hydrolase [Filimonas effusa]|uniref:Alpha/beta hydrolase n=1 Tax=Filimonas effusa TaxID=2508721 RepID=A0A4Q1D4J0_9BACT|nr:alpha/beta hydrolase [Filimonas effusa]RXK83360.1 alpha/beta hydrolase [Filimonas effusa]